jgi:hypothetical protein
MPASNPCLRLGPSEFWGAWAGILLGKAPAGKRGPIGPPNFGVPGRGFGERAGSSRKGSCRKGGAPNFVAAGGIFGARKAKRGAAKEGAFPRISGRQGADSEINGRRVSKYSP